MRPILLLAFAALTACVPAPSASTPAATVSVWSWRPQDAGLWQQVESQLRAQGRNVHIAFTAQDSQQYSSSIDAALANGEGPDLFYDRPGSAIAGHAASTRIEPLDGRADLSQLDPAVLPTVEYRGRHYGIPYAVHTEAVLFNRRWFDLQRLAVPTSWQQLLDLCTTLEGRGVRPFYAAGASQPWELALAADAVAASTVSNRWAGDLIQRRARYTDPTWVRSLLKFKQLSEHFQARFLTTGDQPLAAEHELAEGRTAMIFASTGELAQIRRLNPGLTLGAFLVPPESTALLGGLPGPRDYWESGAKAFWYPDGALVINARAERRPQAQTALAVLQAATSPRFGSWFTSLQETSPLLGVPGPGAGAGPLADAYVWFQARKVTPSFGLGGPLDSPPPAAGHLGAYSAQQSALVAMLAGQLTPAQAATRMQEAVSWYYSSAR